MFPTINNFHSQTQFDWAPNIRQHGNKIHRQQYSAIRSAICSTNISMEQFVNEVFLFFRQSPYSANFSSPSLGENANEILY